MGALLAPAARRKVRALEYERFEHTALDAFKQDDPMQQVVAEHWDRADIGVRLNAELQGLPNKFISFDEYKQLADWSFGGAIGTLSKSLSAEVEYSNKIAWEDALQCRPPE